MRTCRLARELLDGLRLPDPLPAIPDYRVLLDQAPAGLPPAVTPGTTAGTTPGTTPTTTGTTKVTMRVVLAARDGRVLPRAWNIPEQVKTMPLATKLFAAWFTAAL